MGIIGDRFSACYIELITLSSSEHLLMDLAILSIHEYISVLLGLEGLPLRVSLHNFSSYHLGNPGSSPKKIISFSYIEVLRSCEEA